MTSCVPLFNSEKFEFEDEPPQKSQITEQKSEKNINKLINFFTKDFIKFYSLFERTII